jgi:hypothetical protein
MEAMFRRVVFMAAVAAAVAWPVLVAGPAPAAARTMRHAAQGSGSAGVTSVSCPAAGECTAVGFLNPPGLNEVFVLSQAHGRWGRAEKVRGLAALGKGGAVAGGLDSVSCWSPGNCAAGGGYTDHAGAEHAFVVSETNGVWGEAREIRTAPGLHLGSSAYGPDISLMSCPSPGSCTAAGEYLNPAFKTYPFVVGETNGTWGTARELPGVAALKVNLDAFVSSLSCGSAGNCAAAGYYDDSTSDSRSLVAVEKNGTWGDARQVPGTTASYDGISADAESVSCPSAGGCLAVGLYETSAGGQPFLSVLKAGTWSRAKRIPGLSALPGGGATRGEAAWAGCTSPGDCNVIGTYAAARVKGDLSFSVAEANGTWGKAKKIPLGARAADSFIDAVACPSPGNCSAGGLFFAPGSTEVFTVEEKNSRWGTSKEIPGSVALNRGGDAEVSTIACGAPGDCTAGGYYSPVHNRYQPFIATETHGIWGNAEKVPGLP